MTDSITPLTVIKKAIEFAKRELGNQCHEVQPGLYYWELTSADIMDEKIIFYDGDPHDRRGYTGNPLFKMIYSPTQKLFEFFTVNPNLSNKNKIYEIPFAILPGETMDTPRIKKKVKRVGLAIVNLYEEIDDIDQNHPMSNQYMQTRAILRAIHERICKLERDSDK